MLLTTALVFCIITSSNCHEGHFHEESETLNSTGDMWDQSNKLSIQKMTGVELRWISSDPDFLSMEMKSRTTGYISVGFCDHWYGSMKGCDIVIGWVDGNGKGYIGVSHGLIPFIDFMLNEVRFLKKIFLWIKPSCKAKKEIIFYSPGLLCNGQRGSEAGLFARLLSHKSFPKWVRNDDPIQAEMEYRRWRGWRWS